MRIKLAIVLLNLFVLTLCLPAVFIPEIKKLREIESVPYNRLVMDCVVKSVVYHKYLKSKNYISRVVCGYIKVGFTEGIHAWNEVYNPKTKTWIMIDVTGPGSKIDNEGLETKYYKKERMVWYIFNDDVMVKDIRYRRNIKKVFWKNVPLDEIQRLKKLFRTYDKLKSL